MAQAKDLNISPYYDDFDPSNDFYKVLFKPGFPVQARELTNSQSILQNQIGKFGEHIFSEGSMVIGGAPAYDGNYHAVKINSTQFGIDVSLYTDQLIGKVLQGQVSGVTAYVDNIVLPDGGEVEDITLYVTYSKTGFDNSLMKFLDGETLLAKSNIVYGNTTIGADTGVVTLLSNNALAVGSAAFVAEGVYFIRGNFVNVSQQNIILDHYTNTPTYRVGLTVNETIVTAKDDPSLYDNAQGFTNYAAPGADRFKITLTLTKKLIDDENDQDFFEILRVKDGIAGDGISSKPIYSEIAKEFARRTYEESGNYTLDSFDISVANSLDNGLGNDGLFYSTQKTDQGNTPSDDLMCVKVSDGEAYVQGWEVDKTGLTIIDVDKPRDVEKIDNESVDFQMGRRFVVNNVFGQPGYRKKVNLYNEFNTNDLSAPSTSGYTQIGCARIYSFNSKNATYTGPSSEWDLYLWDVQIFTHLTLNVAVTPTEFPLQSIIKGLNSGATGYIDNSPSTTTRNLYQVNGTFMLNEEVSVNGIPSGVAIKSINSHSVKDVLSVWQDKTVTGLTQNFSADISLTEFPFPNGITQIDIQTGTVKSPGNFITGIQTGQVIKYTNTNKSDPTYNRIATVAADGKSFTVAAIGDGVTGVFDKDVGGDGTYNDVKIAGATLWSGDNNGGLYEVLPKPNISSVDLSSSSMVVCAQISGESISGAAGTVSINDVKDGAGVAISTAFFEPYALSNYSIHYGDTAKIGYAGTVTSDSFSFPQLNEAGTGGSLVQFTGVSDDTNTLVNVAVKKQGIRSKVKNYERSKILSVTLSRKKESGESGSDENNSIDDGLDYNNEAYGLRVQDEEISLNVPDVVKVLAIYESVNGSQPTFDTLSFNATVNVLENAIIGENIVGEDTNAIARVVTNNSSSPSTGDVNKLGIVYLTRQTFNTNEIVRFEESNITTQIQGSNLSSSDGQYQDISKFYSLDKGQRNQFYDYSRIVRKDDRIPSQQLLIVYDHYTVPVDDVGDVFTVLSYNKDRYTNDIPLIGPSRIRATDTLDFRPRVPEFSGTTSSPFTFEARNSISTTNAPQYLLKNKETSVLGYEYYLPRIDKIYLSTRGEVTVLKGQSSSSPKSPAIINDAMELATLILPPYLYNTNNVAIRMVDNRRYTMRDIGSLEDRIENLEEVTTLSLLEVATESLTIVDANGNTKYKSGFYVDNFKTRINIDEQRSNITNNKILGDIRPVSIQKSIALQPMPKEEGGGDDNGKDYQLLDTNVIKVGNRILLDYKPDVLFLDQTFATKVQNVNPHHVVFYKGTITLTPSEDTGWTQPVYLDTSVSSNDWLDKFYAENNIGGIGGYLDQEARDYWTGKGFAGTIEATKDIIQATAESPAENTWNSDKVLENNIVSPNVKQAGSGDENWMRNRNVKVDGINFKANTQYYQYLGGRPDVAFIPKLLEIATDSSLETSGTQEGEFVIGETVKAYQASEYQVENSAIGGSVGNNPAMTFRVCSPNHKKGPYNDPNTTYLYNPYDSDGSSEALPSEYTSTTPILNIDIISLCNESQPKYAGLVWPPSRKIGITIEAPKMYLKGETSNAKAWVKDVRIIADLFGDIQGSFYLQNPWLDPPVTARIPAGRAIYRLTSSSTNAKILPGSTINSAGQTRYTSVAMVQNKSRDIETIKDVDQLYYQTTTLPTFVGEYDDPLAQSFLVGSKFIEARAEGDTLNDDDYGVFITSVNLYFANKDTDNKTLTVQLREMKLGTPTKKVIEGSVKELTPDEIQTSTDGTVPTNVKFDQPVYLKGGYEYAIVILSSQSTEYELWCAEMGAVTVEPQQYDNVKDRKYTKQWDVGSLFTSQNGSIWTPEQTQDLKFELFKAEFQHESGTVYLSNPPMSSSSDGTIHPTDLTLLKNNPIVTLPKTGKIGISTIFNGDSNLAHFTVGRKVVGSGNDNVTASIVSIGSTVDDTEVTTGGSNYETGTTNTEVSTFNVAGKGSGLTFNTVQASGGAIDSLVIANPGTGYTTGTVVGLTTADLDGRIGSGALISITAINGVDTLYVSNVHGTNGTGGFKEGTNIRYYNDLGVIATPSISMLNGGLTVDGAPYDGQHFKVHQNNHGMHSPLNKLKLNNISSNLETTKINENVANSNDPDSTGTIDTISVGSTTSPNLDFFEGVKVGAANTGYILIDNEIIGYEEVNSNSLAILSRGSFSSTEDSHTSDAIVQKYELNGVSLARINSEHTISSTDIELDSYYVKINDIGNGTIRSGANESASTSNPSELSFNNEGFYGGSSALGTRNIQFESVVPQFKIWAPGEGVTKYNMSMRTVSGTSVDGNEVSFIDQGYKQMENDVRTKYTTPRIVASKINEDAYLDNIQRNKSTTVAVQFATDNKNVSPVYFMDESSITFETSNLNQPVTNYIDNNLVKSSSLNFDPNSAIYVTNKIRLQNPADSLKVIFDAYRHSSSDIRVLYSLIRPDDDEQVYNKFQLFPGYDNLRDTTGDGFGDQVIDPNKNDGTSDAFVPASKDNQFLEYQYTADNLGEFIGYSIKIIMTGTNQAHVPKISQLRTIAIK